MDNTYNNRKSDSSALIKEITSSYAKNKSFSEDDKKRAKQLCLMLQDNSQKKQETIETLKIVVIQESTPIVSFLMYQILFAHVSASTSPVASEYLLVFHALLNEVESKRNHPEFISDVLLFDITSLIDNLSSETLARSLIFFDSAEIKKYAHTRFPKIKKMLLEMYFIGDYFCTGLCLGEGQWGSVYKGIHRVTGTVVALKKISFHDKTEQTRNILLREIQVLRTINHPSIVQLYDATLDESRQYLFMIMEFSPYGDLENYFSKVKQGYLTMEEVRHFMKELANSLEFLRSQSIVHRDLKPANVLIFMENSVPKLKLCDFTYAKILKPKDFTQTICGSPLYMAPEILSAKEYTEKSDLWSVGVIMFRLIYNQYPFNSDSICGLIQCLEKESLKFPNNREIDENARLLISGLLMKDPQHRMGWTQFFSHPFLNPPLVNNHQKLQEENNKLIKQKSELEVQVVEQERHIKMLKDRLDRATEEKEKEIQKMKEEKDRVTEEKEKEIQKMKEEKVNLEENVGALNQEVEILKGILKTLDAQKQTENNCLSKIISELEDKTKLLEETLKDREEEIHRCRFKKK